MTLLAADGHPDALSLIANIVAERVTPPAPMSVSEWMAKNVVLIDGPQAGERWSPAGAPYLVEIADCLSDDHPCNLVTVRKSQQTGASILALGWCLFIADREPANVLYAVPGLDALRTLNSQKLQPLIEAWERSSRRQVFAPTTSRSSQGSTTYEKRFGLNWLSLANANAVMDLSMVTPRKGVKDELSKWSLINNDQDPENLFFGRFTSHRRLKSWKILEISTPEVDAGAQREDGSIDPEAPGHCRIDRSFARSDQRFWNVRCPECRRLFVHDIAHFIVDHERPSRSRYRCQHCGHELSEPERVVAVREGLWIASREGDDRHPGFHIDAFVSLMMSYEAIAEDFIKQGKTESGRKDFANLVLGLPYRYRGDAPDHTRLMDKRDGTLQRHHIPAKGLMLVAAADVQMRGIYYEVLAIAPDRQSWTVDADFLVGSTELAMGLSSSGEPNAFDQLKERVLKREYPDAFGGKRRVDALGVDAGYRSHIVYAWVHNNQELHPDTGLDLVYALDGRDGWGRPAIGAPKLVDINLEGGRIKQGAKLWPVGTWPLKGEVYSHFRTTLGAEIGGDLTGVCHFGTWLDDAYFRQLVSETLEDVIVKGKHLGRKWVARGENHWFDCRVYNMALGEHLGLSTTTQDEWAELARRRGLPKEAIAEGLFAPRRADSETSPAPAQSGAPELKAPTDPFARLASLNRE